MNIVDQQTFRDCDVLHGRGGQYHHTTDGPAGRAGFTASAVCSVTDTPPTLLGVPESWGVRLAGIQWKIETLCVNTLSAGQEPLSNLFGGKTPIENTASPSPPAGRAGVDADARNWKRRWFRLTAVSCQAAGVGTHDILFCAIEAIHRHATPYGLVWFDRSYHALMRPAC